MGTFNLWFGCRQQSHPPAASQPEGDEANIFSVCRRDCSNFSKIEVLYLLGGGLRVRERLHAIGLVESRLIRFLTQNSTLV